VRFLALRSVSSLSHSHISYVVATSSRVASLDVVASTFLYDGMLQFVWRDDRICPLFPAIPGRFMLGTPIPVDNFTDIWWPEPMLLNAGTPPGDGSLPSLTFDLTAYSFADIGGNVFAQSVGLLDADASTTAEEESVACWLAIKSRVFLDIALRAQLKDFPYDTQDVGILIESQRESSSELQFQAALPNYDTLVPDAAVDGWSVLGAGSVSYEKYIPSVSVAFPRIYLYLRLSRLASIYNLRFVAGTVLLNVLALMGMVLRGEWINDRLNLPLACFLGIVSWQFILVSSTPALGYATRMDNFLIMSLVFNTAIFASSSCHMMLWGYCGDAVKARLAAQEDAEAADGASTVAQLLRVGEHPGGNDCGLEKQPPARLWSACWPPAPLLWDRLARFISRYEAFMRFLLSSVAYIVASYLVLKGGLPEVDPPVMRVETCPGGWNLTGVVHCNGGVNSSVLPNPLFLGSSFKSLPDEWTRR